MFFLQEPFDDRLLVFSVLQELERFCATDRVNALRRHQTASNLDAIPQSCDDARLVCFPYVLSFRAE